MECISIIVPVFNVEDYLSNCLDSIICQSYTNLDILLIDDGSTDQSALICDEYAQRDGRIRVIHQRNGGVSSARNTGLLLARGEFITFVDSDDMLFPNAIEELINTLKCNDADMALGKFVFLDKTGRMADEKASFEKMLFKGVEFLEAALEDDLLLQTVWRILYRKSFIKDLRFEEKRIIGEDGFFVFLCALRRPTVALNENRVYLYRDNPRSVTRGGYYLKKREDNLHFLSERLRLIKERYPHWNELSQNLIVKAHMKELKCMSESFSNVWRPYEKESLQKVIQFRCSYVPGTRLNQIWFWILTHNLYFLYKFIKRVMTIDKACNHSGGGDSYDG